MNETNEHDSTPIISEPVIQEQPDALQYGVDAVALFPQLTRRLFEDKYGVQAREFNPAWAVQTWLDTTAPGRDRTYKKLTPSGLREFTVGAAQRARPNLPGRYNYPIPHFAPTATVQAFPDGRREPVPPYQLTTLAQAEALRDEIGAHTIEEDQKPGFPYLYPADETRRMHLIIGRGYSAHAWLLQQLRNSHGVGAPGHWDTTEPTNLRWIGGPFPDGSGVHMYRPVPVRELLPNEKVVELFGGLAAIRRTDGGAVGDRGFTAADRVMLRGIADDSAEILRQLAALEHRQTAD